MNGQFKFFRPPDNVQQGTDTGALFRQDAVQVSNAPDRNSIKPDHGISPAQ
jgi:hypothetical protein